MKAIAIVGARPQFIKHYPFELACRGKLELITIHTGQHFDENMSIVFFDQLGMSRPNYILNVESYNHGSQTGEMMEKLEKIFQIENPDLAIVYGDTNSTIAGALVAVKLGIKVAHIEAGLRSYNRTMPEEINRVITDHISEWLFSPSELSKNNLMKEGITKNVHVIGDIMKDLLLYSLDRKLIVTPKIDEEYYYVTLHRPYNVDIRERLYYILDTLNKLDLQVVFAIHPRTKKTFNEFGFAENDFNNVLFIDPQPYFENIGYIAKCKSLITDSGGMQKEAYWMKKKCVTIRSETEWVETLQGNANILIFDDLSLLNNILQETEISFNESLYGDGDSCGKIIEIISLK